jgi:hypothetical protein
MTRSVGHDQLETVCGWIRSSATDQGPEHSRSLINSLHGTAIRDVAAAFCDLQAARHRADYDHLADFTKTDTLAYIQDAETAMARFTAASARDPEAFLTLIALKSGIK